MKLIRKLPTRLNKNGHLESWGLFKCPDYYCGKEVEKRLSQGLRDKSCGCMKNQLAGKTNTIHGGTGTRLFNIWRDMLQRCKNPKYKQYKDYGGRGIIVCPEWANDYVKFRDWAMSNGYSEELQINRIFNDGNYETNNCNFVTPKENANNRRNSKKYKNVQYRKFPITK